MSGEMSGIEDNRKKVESFENPSTSDAAEEFKQDVTIRVEMGGKEEDPKDRDEKQDAEKPLMDSERAGENPPATEVTFEGHKAKDTPTLPLPPYKSRSDENDLDRPVPPSIFTAPVARVRYEWELSTGLVEFFTKTICILFASIGWITIIGGAPLLSIVQLIIGSIYNGQCPAEPRIPEYLIVSGFFGTILHVVAYCTKYAPKDKAGFAQGQRRRCLCLEAVLQIFLLIWFIAGCSWVYGIYEPEYELEYHDDYCHKTVYLFAFWTFNITFLMIILFIVLGISCIACIAMSNGKGETPSTA